MISTIEDAIKLCKNEVILKGVLSELDIDVRRTSDNDITLTYKGVVDVNDSYISFYGRVSNGSSMFTSVAKELNALESEIKTESEDGEVVDTSYSNKASRIYMHGGIISPNSIRADYISASTFHPSFLAHIVGVYLGKHDDVDRILIINPYYHNIIHVKCDGDYSKLINKTVCVDMDISPYNEDMPPIGVVNIYKASEQISPNVIDQAKLEHDIYLESMSK